MIQSGTEVGLLTIESNYPVEETIDRLREAD
jgi:uncharacterized protein (DUF302 family)